MSKTIKYDLNPEEDSYNGYVEITLKKGVLGKTKMENFKFFFDKGGSGLTGESYSGHNKPYGVRKDKEYVSDSLELAKELHDLGVEISAREGKIKLVDKGDAEVSIVEDEKGLKSIVAEENDRNHFDFSRSIKAILRGDGSWDIRKRSIAVEEYVPKDKAKKLLMADSEKWKVFEKYVNRAFSEF